MMDTSRPSNIEISRDGTAITIHVPLSFRRGGGRKLVISPDGHEQWAPPRPCIDKPLVKALVRAFRWKDMLEKGQFATVNELARAESMNSSYVGHVLRMTLLAPDIIEAILDGCQPCEMQLQSLIRKGFPVEWETQQHQMADRC